MWNPLQEKQRTRRELGTRAPIVGTFPTRRRLELQQPATRDYSLGRIAVPLVSGVAATEAQSTIAARNFSKITLTFALPTERSDFSHVNIWVKGYQGNANFVKMGEAKVSPAILLLEGSSETLTIAMQSEAIDRTVSDVEKSPTAVVVNDAT